MKLLNRVIFGVLILLMAGCSERTMNLINLGASRSQMEASVRKQEALYLELKDDIKSNRLKPGLTKKRIIDRYGEPILNKPNFFLYRHPTEYFSSDLVYLYFDQNGVLASWEIKPAK